MPDILVLGEPLLEFAATDRGHLRDMGNFRRGWGGDTSNFAVAAARLGFSAGCLTRIGDDEFGRCFLDLWQREGIDTSRVLVDPEHPTGIYFIAYGADGGHEFTYYRHGSAASHLRPEDLDEDYLAQAGLLHTSGITQAISDSAARTVEAAMSLAQADGLTVSYDANVRPQLRPLGTLRRNFEAGARKADLVFLSSEDATRLFPGRPLEEVLAEILDQGVRVVALKRGPDGCVIASADEDEPVVIPAWDIDPVDASGAGDGFAAAFTGAWLDGERDLGRLGLVANAVGALTTTGLGAVEPLPARPRVEGFLAEARLREAGGLHDAPAEA